MKSKFTYEEKQAILNRYILKSESPTSIIESVGISKSTFYKWLSDYRAERAEAKRKGLTLRNFNLLEAKVKRLEGIIEIIQKANVLPNAPLQQKLYVAEKLSGEYSVHMICDALDIACGTYYNHVLRNKRDNTWYAKRREELRIQIQESFDENHQIFGAEKITAVLKSKGIKTSTKMVRELMRDMGLVSIR
jgi:transposase